jgi:hypothetical protein
MLEDLGQQFRQTQHALRRVSAAGVARDGSVARYDDD